MLTSRFYQTGLLPESLKRSLFRSEFNWKPAWDGEQALKVYVDYTNKKKETCEVNNWNSPFLAKVVDLTPPELEIDYPEDGARVDAGYLTVSGTIEDTNRNLTVDVNGQNALISGESWSASVPVVSGPNTIVVSAVDGENNTGRELIVVEGKESSTDSKESSQSDLTVSSKAENETEPVNQSILGSQTREYEKQAVLSPISEGIGFISAILFLRYRNRGKRL